MKENGGGVNSNMMYLIYYKNFCKCHNVPSPSKTIKKVNETEKNAVSIEYGKHTHKSSRT
jgi:hypothetical protein